VTGELNPKFSFDAFAVGSGSEFAATAAGAVAARPGGMYNPLYVYGGEGVGKTHLLMAVGLKASQADPPHSVEYMTPDRLAEAFNAAASAGQTEAFRHRLAEVDVLLVDDAHLLDRRRDVQTELAHLIPAAQSGGRHVLFAGRCPPHDIDNFDASLALLIDGGLVVEIGAPDYETRLRVLQSRARERMADLDEAVLAAVAEFDIANVRELVSLLNRLIALDAVSETPLTPEGARSLLEGEALAVDTSPRPSLMTDRRPSVQDEFADFLSEVSVAVEQQVTAWEQDLADAIERWGKEGIDTARLEDLLDQSTPVPVEEAIEEFERDAQRLVSLRKSVSEVDPLRADDPLFRDPDRVSEAQNLAEVIAPQAESPPGPSPAWTFNNYISSEANRRTDQAMQGLESLQVSGKVIVVVGRTGVGKTHLLHAAGNALTSALGSGVACMSAREFRDMIAQAERENRLPAVRSMFQQSRALLVDDIQLLVGSDSAQQELTSLMGSLLADGRPVACTANAPPGEIEGLSDELMAHLRDGERFVLLPPDREFRRSLVDRMLIGGDVDADTELVDYLADRPADSVRAVTGLVHRVLEAAGARSVTPSAGLARELIEGALPRARRSSAGLRTSGVVVTAAGGIQSREKMIWNWPDPAERLIEELI
jgi:chromosomal replication initiation ATPase DnaA